MVSRLRVRKSGNHEPTVRVLQLSKVCCRGVGCQTGGAADVLWISIAVVPGNLRPGFFECGMLNEFPNVD